MGGFVQAVCIKPEQWKAELHNYKKIISGVLLQLLNFGLKKHLISVLDILHFHVHIQNWSIDVQVQNRCIVILSQLKTVSQPKAVIV